MFSLDCTALRRHGLRAGRTGYTRTVQLQNPFCPAGLRSGRGMRRQVCSTIGERVIPQMRFFKPVVVVAAICATMLTVRRMWPRQTARGKRRGLRRAR